MKTKVYIRSLVEDADVPGLISLVESEEVSPDEAKVLVEALVAGTMLSMMVSDPLPFLQEAWNLGAGEVKIQGQLLSRPLVFRGSSGTERTLEVVMMGDRWTSFFGGRDLSVLLVDSEMTPEDMQACDGLLVIRDPSATRAAVVPIRELHRGPLQGFIDSGLITADRVDYLDLEGFQKQWDEISDVLWSENPQVFVLEHEEPCLIEIDHRDDGSMSISMNRPFL